MLALCCAPHESWLPRDVRIVRALGLVPALLARAARHPGARDHVASDRVVRLARRHLPRDPPRLGLAPATAAPPAVAAPAARAADARGERAADQRELAALHLGREQRPCGGVEPRLLHQPAG